MQLFDYIAGCIAGFVHDHHLEKRSLPLGFTFSFPCSQEGLAIGRLVTWTKGFKCPGVEGEDVVALLHSAIKRRSVCVLQMRHFFIMCILTSCCFVCFIKYYSNWILVVKSFPIILEIIFTDT